MDYYAILGLEKDCSIDDIKKAYKKLALQYHPDRHTTNKEYNEKRFVEVSQAYEILSDPNSKQKYDLQNDINITFTSPLQLFAQLFSTIYPELIGVIKENESVLKIPLLLLNHMVKKNPEFKLKEAKANPTTLEIKIPLIEYYQNPYKKVTLEIKKRSSIYDNEFIYKKKEFILNLSLSEQIFEFCGHEDNENLYPGDIIFLISDIEDSDFKRHNEYNLIHNHTISLSEYTNGFTHTINFLGTPLCIYIERPWDSFNVYKLENYGLRNFIDNIYGDLIIVLKLNISDKTIRQLDKDYQMYHCPKKITLL